MHHQRAASGNQASRVHGKAMLPRSGTWQRKDRMTLMGRHAAKEGQDDSHGQARGKGRTR